MNNTIKPIPVILDTDIGDDFDDMWALVMLLKCPELDIRLITTSIYNTRLKAQIVAKTLSLAGRDDIPIGIGVKTTDDPPPQSSWAADYDLSAYRGIIDEDAAGAIVRTILESPEPITLIAIGPMTTILAALRRDQAIAQRTNFVAMIGRFAESDGDKPKPEHNAKVDIPATKVVFNAPWASITITPSNSCSKVVLRDERYARVLNSNAPLLHEMIQAYRVWNENCSWFTGDCDTESSILFDTVAIYLAWTSRYLQMQNRHIVIGDDGATEIDSSGRNVNIAIGWDDLDGFKEFFITRLLSDVVR